jgi:hypothetical protein
MADKPSQKQIKALERQIKADDKIKPKPSEKPLKINTSFKNAVKELSKSKIKKL